MLDLLPEGPLLWGGIVLALLTALYMASTWNYGEFKKRGMAYAKPWPFFGNFTSFTAGRKSLGDLSMEMYARFKGHRAYGVYNFMKPVVYIRDPDVIRMISVKDFDVFTDHLTVIEEDDDKLFGKGLFNLKGGRWRAMRNTLTPAFTSSKMKAMYALIDKCGEQLADYLQDKCKDGLIHLEMRDLFSRYANDVIATSAYGIHCDSLKQPENEFYKMGVEITDFGGIKAVFIIAFLIVPNFIRFLGIKLTSSKLENFFCSIITDTMATREREKIVRPDMIHLLMEARKGTLTGDDGDDQSEKKLLKLTDDDIAAQAFIFFLAGFDTSSTLLSFLAYELAVNPDIQEKVQQEIDEVLAANDGVLSYDTVQKMKYMDSVISETLRMWPPVVELDRMCLRDYVVPATGSAPAFMIKKGEAAMFPALAIHRDPAYWPEPDRFDPGRFSDENKHKIKPFTYLPFGTGPRACMPDRFDPDRFSDENKHKIKPFTYLPFGTGPRACIGNRFALMETKIAIANVLSTLTLEVTEKTPIPMRLATGTFNVSAEGGMWLGVKSRD